MSNKIELRTYAVTNLRTKRDGDKRTVGGYAAVFNKASENLGIFRAVYEKIAPGAFKRSLKQDDIRAFWNHNVDHILGRTTNNTLRLSEDSYGLEFDLDLPDTTMGRDVFTSIERGDVSSMSFGFRVVSDKVERPEKENDPIMRTLLDVDLVEVSPVVFPAYPQTEVSARGGDVSLDTWAKEQLEAWANVDKEIRAANASIAAKLLSAERDAQIQAKRIK
jgi:uncharacterized protein